MFHLFISFKLPTGEQTLLVTLGFSARIFQLPGGYRSKVVLDGLPAGTINASVWTPMAFFLLPILTLARMKLPAHVGNRGSIRLAGQIVGTP